MNVEITEEDAMIIRAALRHYAKSLEGKNGIFVKIVARLRDKFTVILSDVKNPRAKGE